MKKLIPPSGLKEKGITGSDATIWRAERAGRFPKRVYPTPGRKAWFEDEIDQYLENLRAARDEPAS
jgi:predicted DNA-binding transcriptional regulator AlpA